jgi:hypothetical protein
MSEISRRVTPKTCSILRLHFWSAYHPRDTGDLLTLLKMRFQEPQLLVEGARERDQKIVGIGVARLGGRVDRCAHQTSELGIALDQGRKVIRRRIDLGRIGARVTVLHGWGTQTR